MCMRAPFLVMACAAAGVVFGQGGTGDLQHASDAGQAMYANGFQRPGQVYDLASVQEQPEFVGGMEAMYTYLADSTRYPVELAKAGIGGRVYVEFVVDQGGHVGNVQIRRGVDPALDAEAVRVVGSMPPWKPGRMDGKPVAVRFTLPMVFNPGN